MEPQAQEKGRLWTLILVSVGLFMVVLDNLVIHGTVNKVVDQILAMREDIGDFGELVYGGMDWVDPALAKRSMQLLAEEVMPRVNAAIGKKSAAA